jgi:hypothetical protein
MVVFDQAVRQGGLASVPQIWKFVQKVQAAANAVNPQASPVPPTALDHTPAPPPAAEGK